MQASKVKWNVLEILCEATVQGNALVFAQEYERKIYEETKKVLESIGGKWDRYEKAFLFPGDAAEVIGEIIQTGEVTREVPPGVPANDGQADPGNVISLTEFVADFGDGLMQAVLEQNPPVYDGLADPCREAVMDGLKRQPFPAQREVVQAVARLLVDADEDAAVINGEMGTGKTMMAIAASAVLRAEGYRRVLVISPPHDERFVEVGMSPEQESRYQDLKQRLVAELKEALRKGDKSLMGVVLNALLAWPDCAFRDEMVKHPGAGTLLAYVGKLFEDTEPAPKEAELIRICREQKAKGRKVLVYTIYTGTRDTAGRLKNLLQAEGFKAAVLRASVDTSKREDWIMDQVDRGIDALICNPELVKTGLDLLDFPAIVFQQPGYNTFTVQQASRRSWRIGQKQPVEVYYLGYAETAQIDCLALMAKKIAVSQSTSGEMPETGLDVLNQDGDSLEVALAKRLVG